MEKINAHCHRLGGHSLLVRHKQDGGRRFILLLPYAAVLPGSDAGRNGVMPASGFVRLRAPCGAR